MSLLRDIQDALASEACDVAVVLRKCKILAARLGSDEFGAWVSDRAGMGIQTRNRFLNTGD